MGISLYIEGEACCSRVTIHLTKTLKYLADPGEARGCSTNTFVIHQVILVPRLRVSLQSSAGSLVMVHNFIIFRQVETVITQ